MKKISLYNLIIAVLFIIAFYTSKHIFPQVKFLPGLALIIMSSLNLTFLISCLTKNRFDRAKIILWSGILSLLAPGVFLYSTALFKGGVYYFNHIEMVSLGYLACTYSALLITWLFKRFNFLPDARKGLNFKYRSELLISLIITSLILVVNQFLYKFIPEGDPYTYLVKINDLSREAMIKSNETRPFFALTINWFSKILGISPYWIFKAALPFIITSLSTLTLWIYSRRYLKGTKLVFSSLSFALFPVVLCETLISRPQSFFMLAFVVFLYLLYESIRNKDNPFEIYAVIFILLLSLVNIKTHQFFLFLILLSIICLFVILWKRILRNPLESILITLAIIILSMPWLESFGITSSVKFYWKFFGRVFSNPQFNLWFIDSYKNVDGVEMGWPGITSIFYYAYNLGVVLPLLAITSALNWKKMKSLHVNWLFWMAFLIFFSIAEIFPRLGVAFLPDRAWLFCSLILAFFIPILLANVNLKFLRLWVIVLVIASVLPAMLLIYIKGGYMTSAEFRSAKFLSKNTSKNSLVITQQSNGPLVNFFAERTSETGNKTFFNSRNLKYKVKYIEALYGHDESMMNLDKEIQDMRNSVSKDILQTDKSLIDLRSKIRTIEKLNQILFEKKKGRVTVDEVYVLYSFDKFKGFYASRGWWKSTNYYGAILDDFSDANHFELVYNTPEVKIWKYKK